MKKWLLVSSLLLLMMGISNCFNKAEEPIQAKIIKAYREDITGLADAVDRLLEDIENDSTEHDLQQQFYRARKKYKRLEWLAEYYNPYTAKHINGPALEEVEPDDKNIMVKPEGFQVVEELLFPTYAAADKKNLLGEVKLLKSNIGRLQFTAFSTQTTNAHIFDALRLEVFRIIALGISGFDSPIAMNSIQEATASLESIHAYVSYYYCALPEKQQTAVAESEHLFQTAQAFLKEHGDFKKFDRMTFITSFLNPVSQNLHNLQKALNVPFFKEPRMLKATAGTLFSADIFNPDFYTAGQTAYASPEKTMLGAKLFYDVRLSGNEKRSCATCHNPQLAFTDGLKKNSTLDGKTALRRNTPTLINAALQPSLFYDMRVSYLEDQANEVITNKDEMHGSLKKALLYINNNAKYKQLFTAAFGNENINEGNIKNAIASYIRSLVALNSRFDRHMRGEKALNQQEIDGFNLFMGKAKCGTCHFVPLFNGVNPPSFTKTDAEVIGVPATADTSDTYLDKDEGKYYLYKIRLHKNAFKTPTLRNIAVTAPYMHNGVFKTLEEVIDFYDRGGGNGLGLHLENQTLPTERLDLSSNEKKAVVAFLKTLTDTMPTKRHPVN